MEYLQKTDTTPTDGLTSHTKKSPENTKFTYRNNFINPQNYLMIYYESLKFIYIIYSIYELISYSFQSV